MQTETAEHDEIALDAAREIDDAFARGYPGGVTQRTAAVQIIVMAAMGRALDRMIPAEDFSAVEDGAMREARQHFEAERA